MRTNNIHLLRGAVALLVLSLMLCSQRATAQNDRCLDAIYDARSLQIGDAISYPSIGVGVSFGPDLFYPWPIYLRSGVNALFSIKRDGADTPANYRFEVPLELVAQWDPSPFFSIGPYAGVYGAANLLVAPEDPDRFNRWQYGLMAGVSSFVSFFHIYAGYYHDMVPFNKNGAGLDGVRIGIGMML